jgi:hypothetical protein
MLTPARVYKNWRTHDAPAALRQRSPDDLDDMVENVLGDGTGPVLLGPIVMDPRQPGLDMPPCYFVALAADPVPFSTIIGARTRREAADLRRAVVAKLMRRRIRVHLFDDELALATWAEEEWPGPVTRGIRETIERERRRN